MSLTKPIADITKSALILAALAAVLIAIPVFAESGPRTPSTPQILGAEEHSKQITVTYWLNHHDKAGFDEAVRQIYDRNSPNYHHWLTRDEYKSRFAPTASEMAVVRQHLAAHNLQVVSTDKLNRYVVVRGSVADVQRSTGVTLNRVALNGENHRVPSGKIAISDAAGKVVAAVQGLSDLKYKNYAMRQLDPDTGKPVPLVPLSKLSKAAPAAASGSAQQYYDAECLRTSETRTFKTGNGGPYAVYSGARYGGNINLGPPALPPCGYDAPQVQKAYGLDALYKSKLNGAGQTVVLVDAYGSDTITSDANIFSQINGLPALTSNNFRIYYPTGPTSCSNNTCGWDVETSLDVEWSHSVAPGADIALVVAADNSFSNLDLAVLFAIDNGIGPVISNSYGLEEYILQTQDPSELTVQNSITQLAASLGISANFSSGDDGDFVLEVGVPTVNMPAASPYATSIGGTSLFLNPDHTMKLQTGWGNNETRIASYSPNPPIIPPLELGFVGGSGGGVSAVWPKPGYQSSLPGSGRLVPDISYLADPYTGGEFIDTEGGQTSIGVVGGTSLACPMFSAMWAIVTQAAGSWLGQAAPLLYALPDGAITDVVAVDGPDNVTGTIHQPPQPPIIETAADLVQPLENTTEFVSALYHGTSTRWYVVSFGTDTSLTIGPGWDDVTGLGTPNGASFVSALAASAK